MSANKAMIRFYACILFISSLLTYIVDLNQQFHFISLNSPFISNSFCFALLSGILTGVIVALAVEIRQYLLHKIQARHALFSTASELYALLSVQKACLKYYINNPDNSIPENIGGDHAQQPIYARISQFKSIDYSTFSKKDALHCALIPFQNEIDALESITRKFVNLRIAYNQTKMDFLSNNDRQSQITATTATMLRTLYEVHNLLDNCLPKLDAFCSVFEKINGSKFRWKQGKKAVDSMSKQIEKNIYYSPNQNH